MTANDYPERDPTNWTLSCVDRDGALSVMSEVDGVVPPTERQMIYGQTYFIDSPPSPPPTPPQMPSPPSPPPPSAPPPGSPCVPVTITVVTTNWASEQSWTMGNGVQTLSGSGYTNYNTETTDACMENGPWTIQLFDTWGDGWSTNSYVEIDHEGTVIGTFGCGNGADDFCTGSLGSVMSFWVGPAPSAPPAAPSYPPGITKHETCLFHIHTVVGGTAMQLAEVTMYDTYGNALSYPSTTATSDCEATGMEASKAVDGNVRRSAPRT